MIFYSRAFAAIKRKTILEHPLRKAKASLKHQIFHIFVELLVVVSHADESLRNRKELINPLSFMKKQQQQRQLLSEKFAQSLC